MSRFLYVRHIDGMTWNVQFSDAHLAAAGVDSTLVRDIQVVIDRDTGATSMSMLAAGTPEQDRGQTLYSLYELEIRQALVDAVLSPNLIHDQVYDALRESTPPRRGL